MKNKILFITALCIGTVTFAQDGLTSKKGEAFLPEAGDWALGFDGTSLINYFGNIANGSTSNSLSLNNFENTFYGKKFKDEKTAYRGMLRIGMGSSTQDSIRNQNSTTPSYTDSYNTSNGFTFIIGAGLEKRRGAGRLQGLYGAQLMFGMLGGGSTTTEYGLDLDPKSTTATSRILENNNGSTLMFGLNGFAGVEYFILPKFSLGAEVNWGLSFQSTGEGELISESIDGSGITAIEKTTTKSGGSSAFLLDNSVGANFKIMFHF